MKLLIYNFTVRGGTSQISYFDDVIMKEAAFNSKSGEKNTAMYYTYCLVPFIEKTECDELDFNAEYYNIVSRGCNNENHIFSLYKFLKPTSDAKSISQLNISIDFVREIDDTNMNIFYTDGSFKKETDEASYACFQLLEELNQNNMSQPSAMDDYTNKIFCYNKISGVIADGTNNIGELTGIKTAVDNFGDKSFQLIISDSEYSIKAYREWIYNWQKNGYKTYAKKPIANKDLIESTFRNLTSKSKIVFFKWTRGHNNNSFNELCDIEAKAVLGVGK